MKTRRPLIKRIKSLCRQSYPKHNWEGHLIPVVNSSLVLSREYGGDTNIIEAGAYLHDIGRVKFNYLNLLGIGHEVSGYHYSKVKLWQYGCQKEEAERISQCVLRHRGEGRFLPKTIEEEIVMNADAVAQFKMWPYLFSIHYSSHGKSLANTRRWIQEKLERDWSTKITLNGLKEKLEPRYEQIKREIDLTR